QPLFPARRFLQRHEPEPGGEVAATSKGLERRRIRLDRHGGDGSDPWHGLQARCRLAPRGLETECLLELGDLLAGDGDLLEVETTNVADDRLNEAFLVFDCIRKALHVRRA